MRWVVEKRIWVDENTHDKLYKLFKVTRGYINREVLINAIIYEWVKRDYPVDFGILYFDVDGNYENIIRRRFIYFKITESLWNSFNDNGSDLNVNTKFKIAVDYFFKEYSDYQNLLKYLIDTW